MKSIKELKTRLQDVASLSSIISVLDWDQSVHMPAAAAEARSKSVSELSAVVHTRFLEINKDKLLTNLKKFVDTGEIKGKDAVVINETWRDYSRAKKLPEEFVREQAKLLTDAHHVWLTARKENNFKSFLPYLNKIIASKQQEAKYVGYKDSAYDALLDTYEPGMTSKEASEILYSLRDFLVPLLKKIKESKVKINTDKVLGSFDMRKQVEFNELVAKTMGFNFGSGRLDTSAHPFTTTFNKQDVRMTTRYQDENVLYSLGSTIHETGHALYEQGLLSEYHGTPIGDAISLGIHESQSRMWETIIGSSREFWAHFYPLLQKEFPKPFGKIKSEEFYTIINRVNPSFIRTEADEVTYNLHIIIRFEIEKGLIEGTVKTKDLPKIWNQKVKEYLGVDVSSDAVGVLQDVHWSAGLFGYFPTYLFGNLYAAQFFAAMMRDIPDIKKDFVKGDFARALAWLRKNIHMHGKTYTAKALAKKVTGKELDSAAFQSYIENKYKDIYGL